MVLESVRKIVADTIRKKLRSEETDAKSREAAVRFLAGGYIALLTGWLDSDETMPPPTVGAVLRRIYCAQVACGQYPQIASSRRIDLPMRRAKFASVHGASPYHPQREAAPSAPENSEFDPIAVVTENSTRSVRARWRPSTEHVRGHSVATGIKL